MSQLINCTENIFLGSRDCYCSDNGETAGHSKREETDEIITNTDEWRKLLWMG